MTDHLMDIATQQLVAIARTTAYNCVEQHEYMKVAGGTDWFPHKWVVEAMRAAVTIRNTQAEDMVREELHQARAQLAEAQALLREADEFMYIMTAHDGHAKLAHRYGKDWWDAIDKLRGKVCTALSASADPQVKS